MHAVEIEINADSRKELNWKMAPGFLKNWAAKYQAIEIM